MHHRSGTTNSRLMAFLGACAFVAVLAAVIVARREPSTSIVRIASASPTPRAAAVDAREGDVSAAPITDVAAATRTPAPTPTASETATPAPDSAPSTEPMPRPAAMAAPVATPQPSAVALPDSEPPAISSASTAPASTPKATPRPDERPGRIFGRIVGEDGAPVADGVLTLTGDSKDFGRPETITGPDGRYTLEEVPPFKSGWLRIVSAHENLDLRLEVSLKPGETKEVNWDGTAIIDIEGHAIISASGTPGQRVLLSRREPTVAFLTIDCDSSGAFTAKILPGKYYIQVIGAGVIVSHSSPFVEVPAEPKSQTLDLSYPLFEGTLVFDPPLDELPQGSRIAFDNFRPDGSKIHVRPAARKLPFTGEALLPGRARAFVTVERGSVIATSEETPVGPGLENRLVLRLTPTP